jgi:hypothetical protein
MTLAEHARDLGGSPLISTAGSGDALYRKDVKIRVQKIDALSRFSIRD